MSDPLYDATADATPDELRATIETQRQRLALYADALLGLGFEPSELLDAAD